MDEATPADVVSIVAELARPLAASGFDLVAPLQASWYNEEPHIAELPAAHKLPARRADQLALLVANTRALWKPFCRWAKARGAEYLEAHADDALDTYAAEVITAALQEVNQARRIAQARELVALDVAYAHETLETHGRAISVTTCAHVAGLAHYNAEQQRSVHFTYGPWIAYRAIILLDRRCPALPPPPPPRDPCTADEWARVSKLQSECFAKWDDTDEPTNWKRLVDIVHAFDAGKQFAYTDEQVAFHYQHDAKARARHLAKCAEATEEQKTAE